MSGVRAAKSISAEGTQPEPQLGHAEVMAMQDVLYDILANGMDEGRADVPTEAVERFLFEHARSPKQLLEFRAFFAAHKLTLSGRAAQLAPAIALPPIQRNEDRGMPARLPVELSVLSERAEPASFEPFEITATHARKPRRVAMWAGLSLGTAALAGAAFYGYTAITQLQHELHHELQRSAQHSQQNQVALDSLRDQQAGIESSVAATSELVQRMDLKSDLVLQTLTAAEAKKSPRRGH